MNRMMRAVRSGLMVAVVGSMAFSTGCAVPPQLTQLLGNLGGAANRTAAPAQAGNAGGAAAAPAPAGNAGGAANLAAGANRVGAPANVPLPQPRPAGIGQGPDTTGVTADEAQRTNGAASLPGTSPVDEAGFIPPPADLPAPPADNGTVTGDNGTGPSQNFPVP